MELKEWLGDNELSLNIWKNKYQRNNETLDEWFDRISGGNEKVKNLIKQKKFLFGGRILSNRGIKDDEKVTYSNCYVISAPEDSIESIYDSRKKLARTYSYGGGCGIDISKLSPAGARVRNQAKATSGAVSFMQGYSDVTEEIGQNGRRGALMISIDCTHPDLLDFINIKTKEDSVTKANISVKVSDDFMSAVIADKDWELSFTREETGEKISKIVKAKDIFRILCENNWNWAEPGILYWDNISNWNLLSTNKDFEYAGVNPCAEEPLPAGGSCLLGSINLSAFVKYPYEKSSFIDLEELKEAVYIAVDALNEVLDEGMQLHPLAEQRESVQKWRQIGLGIMGLADMLIKLGIEYGSDESLELIDLIGTTIINSALIESNNLASQYGAYPAYTEDVLKSKFFIYNTRGLDSLINQIKLYGLRNSQLLTCAPTGSIATMLGISNGIEPLFAKSWQRKTESLHGKDVFYTERPKVIEELMEFRGIDKDEDLPDYVITAHEIDPFNRIKVQSILQDHIDASISSTINISKDATVKDVEDIYLQAWNSRLKGVTIYREGSMREGILTTEESKSEKKENIYNKPERGEVLPVNDSDAIGFKRKLMTGCGSLHCTAFFDVNTGELVETYLSKGSTGGCNNFMVGLSRMISMASRAGVSIQDIVDQLMSTGSCPSYAARSATKRDTSKGSCCPMAVGYALKEMWEEFQGKEMKPKEIKTTSAKDKKGEKVMKTNYTTCPECGEQLSFEGGCNICKSCGYTKCD